MYPLPRSDWLQSIPPLAAPRVNLLQHQSHLCQPCAHRGLSAHQGSSPSFWAWRVPAFSITSLSSQVTRSVLLTPAPSSFPERDTHFASVSSPLVASWKDQKAREWDLGPVWCKDGVCVLCPSPQSAVLLVWAWSWLDPQGTDCCVLGPHTVGLLWGLLASCSIYQTFNLTALPSSPEMMGDPGVRCSSAHISSQLPWVGSPIPPWGCDQEVIMGHISCRQWMLISMKTSLFTSQLDYKILYPAF